VLNQRLLPLLVGNTASNCLALPFVAAFIPHMIFIPLLEILRDGIVTGSAKSTHP
jgi:hypothetical protein